MADALSLAQAILQRKMQQDPNIVNKTPWASAAINAIMNGDAKTGMEIANNLCASANVSPEQLINAFNQGQINLDI